MQRTTSTLYIFGRFQAAAGNEKAVAAAIARVVEHTREEPACVDIHAFRAVRDSQLFFIHSEWRDAAAFEAHALLPHTREFIETVVPMLTHELDVTRTTRIG